MMPLDYLGSGHDRAGRRISLRHARHAHTQGAPARGTPRLRRRPAHQEPARLRRRSVNVIRKLPGFYLIRLFLAGSVLASGLQAAARQKAGATLSSYERTLRVLDAGIEALGGLALESGG